VIDTPPWYSWYPRGVSSTHAKGKVATDFVVAFGFGYGFRYVTPYSGYATGQLYPVAVVTGR